VLHGSVRLAAYTPERLADADTRTLLHSIWSLEQAGDLLGLGR
jgi:hypothetical protein